MHVVPNRLRLPRKLRTVLALVVSYVGMGLGEGLLTFSDGDFGIWVFTLQSKTDMQH